MILKSRKDCQMISSFVLPTSHFPTLHCHQHLPEAIKTSSFFAVACANFSFKMRSLLT